MLGCRKTNESDVLTVLAWSDRDVVFGEKSEKISHGTTWFHNTNRGIGFNKFGHVGAGKDPCDTPKSDHDAQFRLCWALVESDEEANRRGFTCGAWERRAGLSKLSPEVEQDLKGWEKVILHADDNSFVEKE